MAIDDVVIRLTPAEFVVLDHLLRRYSESKRFVIADDAERQALWNLQCLLEKEPSRGDSLPSLEDAKSAL